MALFFMAPLITLARFSLQNVPTILLGWSTLFNKWSLNGLTKAFHDPAFWPALKLSLQLAVGTVLLTIGLLLPTAIWTHLRVPKARSVIEFMTVLPYMIPAIALVAGIKIIQRTLGGSELRLLAHPVLRDPRPAVHVPLARRRPEGDRPANTVDASRSLGAGWGSTVLRVVIPNLRTAIISASFLTAAVVIGEFTIADTLLKETLPRFQATFTSREPQGGYGLNLLALLVTIALFVVLSIITKKRDPKRKSFARIAANAAARPGTT